jgi:hypothetical protein
LNLQQIEAILRELVELRRERAREPSAEGRVRLLLQSKILRRTIYTDEAEFSARSKASLLKEINDLYRREPNQDRIKEAGISIRLGLLWNAIRRKSVD